MNVGSADALSPNEQEAVAEVIDNEAIIIRVSDGVYYSLDKTGGFIWQLIQQNGKVSDIVDAVTRCYGIPQQQAHADVLRLAEELVRERLVCVSPNAGPNAPPAALPAAPAGATAYETPRLNVYSDMSDLLALDPPAPGMSDLAWGPTDTEPAPAGTARTEPA